MSTGKYRIQYSVKCTVPNTVRCTLCGGRSYSTVQRTVKYCSVERTVPVGTLLITGICGNFLAFTSYEFAGILLHDTVPVVVLWNPVDSLAPPQSFCFSMMCPAVRLCDPYLHRVPHGGC